MPKPINQFDFPLQKKRKEEPKPRHIAKREFYPRDLTLIRKNVPLNKQQESILYSNTSGEKYTKRSYKPLQIFASIAVLLVFVFQILFYLGGAKKSSGEILGVATSAYDDLNSASENLKSQNFSEAQNLFKSALDDLSQANNELDRYWLLTNIIPQAKSADRVLKGAEYLALAGGRLTSALELFKNLSVSSKGIEDANFMSVLEASKNDLATALKFLEQANEEFSRANNLPKEYEQSITQAKLQTELLSKLLGKLLSFEELYLSLFGSQDKTYLLIFQNYDELRATGGFIGTYGVLKISNGAITMLKIDSIYNLDGAIYQQIAAPGPFQPDINKWGIRDANWFVDFPTTAEKLLYFYEKGKETADRVLAFTPKLFEDLLTVTGPVQMTDYDVVLTAENFQELVQEETSVKYDKTLNQPKKFLADFAPIFLDKMKGLTQEQWLNVLDHMANSFATKDLLLYSKDSATQTKIANLGFSGAISEADRDYLAVFNSNLGGTKTDLEITQDLNIQTVIRNDGSVMNTVKLTRNNSSQQDNTSFVRILIPKDSVFLNASGFEDKPQFSSVAEGFVTDDQLSEWDKRTIVPNNVTIRSEADKTEFAGWIKTLGVSSKTITVSYLLPFKIEFSTLSRTNPYSMLFQKQPGATRTNISGSINLGSFNPVWNSTNVNINSDIASYTSEGMKDELWSVLLSE